MSCFVDTNIWLYAYLATPDQQRHKRARRSIEDATDLFISDQVVNEVVANLLRKGRLSEPEILCRIEDLNERCVITRLDVCVHRRASELRGNDPQAFSYWDSLIIAAALESGCRKLWTEDLQHGRMIDDYLHIVNPLLDHPG